MALLYHHYHQHPHHLRHKHHLHQQWRQLNGPGNHRVFLILIIELLILFVNGSHSISSSHLERDKAPDPQITITKQPQPIAYVTEITPIILSCNVNHTGPYYNELNDEIFLTNYNESNDYYSSIIRENDERSSTSFYIKYSWYRNDIRMELESKESNFSQDVFYMFKNGSLKISYHQLAMGSYRCSADGSLLGIGGVVSQASFVQLAEFAPIPSKSNVVAYVDESIWLDCPFKSLPLATIFWYFANDSIINFDNNSRYLQLNNGSLLIARVQLSDNQIFKCTARNTYIPQRNGSHSINVHVKKSQSNLQSVSTESIHFGQQRLLPALQIQQHRIKQGESLQLVCIAPGNITVQWSFSHRSNLLLRKNISKPSNRLFIQSVTYDNNNGVYNCSTTTDFQLYYVTVIVPPIIVDHFNSVKDKLGFYIMFHCNATGYPKPKITWFKNGRFINFDHTITQREDKLIINTYEQYHEGVYQCVASNEAGEAQVAGQLSWIHKNYANKLNDVHCYPVNPKTIFLTFKTDSNYVWRKLLYYIASNKTKPLWQSDHTNCFEGKNQFKIINISKRPLLEPFWLYLRGLELSAADGGRQSGGFGLSRNLPTKEIYEMSRLSDGVKCSLQGVSVYPIFNELGTYIWWHTIKVPSKVKLTIQFRHSEKSKPIQFDQQIVGTVNMLQNPHIWDIVEHNLRRIPANTYIIKNTLPPERYDHSRECKVNTLSNAKGIGTELKEFNITEVQVSSNVTGILVPNTKDFAVRILISLDLIVIDQNEMKFVEWTIINATTSLDSKLIINNVESRSVVLHTNDTTLDCIHVCHEDACLNVTQKKTFFYIKSLRSFTPYTFYISDCRDGNSRVVLNTHTKRDVPGPIADYNITRSNDNNIVLIWKPPNNLRNISHYLLEWTMNNHHNSENISINLVQFELPDTNTVKNLNISFRAIGTIGDEILGIPVYIKLKDFPIPQDDFTASNFSYNNPALGISIGVVLSLLCIAAFLFIMFRYKACTKRLTNGTVPTRNMSNQMSCLFTSTGQSFSSPPPPTDCSNVDMNEAETLIGRKDEDNTRVVNSVPSQQNGKKIHLLGGKGDLFDGGVLKNGLNSSITLPISDAVNANVNGTLIIQPVPELGANICGPMPNGRTNCANFQRAKLPQNKSADSLCLLQHSNNYKVSPSSLPPMSFYEDCGLMPNYQHACFLDSNSNNSIMDTSQQILLPFEEVPSFESSCEEPFELTDKCDHNLLPNRSYPSVNIINNDNLDFDRRTIPDQNSGKNNTCYRINDQLKNWDDYRRPIIGPNG